MVGVRTLAIAILDQTNWQNKKAQSENFSDDFDSLIITLRNLTFYRKARLVESFKSELN